jgi:cell division protein FtsB
MLATLKKAIWSFAVLALVLILFIPGFAKLQGLRGKNVDLEDKIRRLSVENALLQQELRRIENDPVYSERIAREKMGVVRKGEIPIKIIPEKSRR